MYIFAVTPRMRRVDWKRPPASITQGNHLSRLAWGVWIENSCLSIWYDRKYQVTPRMRRVDWKLVQMQCNVSGIVTPRMRRVDWNRFAPSGDCLLLVTPRMRRVDWNNPINAALTTNDASRLAWGVWIEIGVIPISFAHLPSRLAWGVRDYITFAEQENA